MVRIKTLKKVEFNESEGSELLIIPKKKLLDWYKYEREV